MTSGGGGDTAEICTETLLTTAEFMHQISDCSRKDFDKKGATFQGWRGGGRMEGGGSGGGQIEGWRVGKDKGLGVGMEG